MTDNKKNLEKNQKKKNQYEFYIKHERPEEFAGDPLEFYTSKRVNEYAQSKALMRIQERIAKRALEIAQIEPPARVLDLGMGCGFASTYMLLNHFQVVGIDINFLFLTYYNIQKLNPLQTDMRDMGFRKNSFDLIISISAIQWILAEKKEIKRLKFLKSLADQCSIILNHGGKIVFQFYPKSDSAMHEVGKVFSDTEKFNGNFIIDNPDNPKKRKIYLYLEKK